MRIRVPIVLIVSLAAMLATACGSRSNSEVPSTTPTTTLSMPVETFFVRAYFFRDGKLAPVGRSGSEMRRSALFSRARTQPSAGSVSARRFRLGSGRSGSCSMVKR